MGCAGSQPPNSKTTEPIQATPRNQSRQAGASAAAPQNPINQETGHSPLVESSPKHSRRQASAFPDTAEAPPAPVIKRVHSYEVGEGQDEEMKISVNPAVVQTVPASGASMPSALKAYAHLLPQDEAALVQGAEEKVEEEAVEDQVTDEGFNFGHVLLNIVSDFKIK